MGFGLFSWWHVAPGETNEEAIIREVFETSVSFKENEIKLIFKDINQAIKDNNQIDYVYIVNKDLDLNAIKIDPEVEEFIWIDIGSF